MNYRNLLVAGVAPTLMLIISATTATAAVGQTPAGTPTVTIDGVSCGTNSGTFPALSWHVGVTNTQTTTGGGGGAGKAVFSDLVVQKAFDDCTPRLFLLAATGQHLRKVVVTEVDRNGKPTLVVQIEDVVLSSSQIRDQGANAGAVEEISMSYTMLTITEPAAGNTARTIAR